jgi:hypothetical protein
MVKTSRFLIPAAIALAMAACSPAPEESPDRTEVSPPTRPSFMVAPAPDGQAGPDAANPPPGGGFADGWVAVAVTDDGTTGLAELQDTMNGRHLQARRPAQPGEPEFVRLEKSDAGDHVVLRFEGATARVPLLAQQSSLDGAAGVPVWSDPMDGLPADASAPVYSSPLDGITPEEIAAAPVFPSALEVGTDLSVVPVLQGADDPWPTGPVPAAKEGQP